MPFKAKAVTGIFKSNGNPTLLCSNKCLNSLDYKYQTSVYMIDSNNTLAYNITAYHRAYYRENQLHSQGRLLALPTNIRLGQK